jgi:hypothetical protein
MAAVENRKIVCHADPFLGNDHEIGSYTTTVK